ncbi:MAG: hypothetical protein B6U88_03190 [Candidatus Aenigmarchaeota archaeon ex4484_56]|nr:MAG: hypothetical protein B6U88_03190 [Candidatus Aenigmarchaeota archaeon ex4484_56]
MCQHLRVYDLKNVERAREYTADYIVADTSAILYGLKTKRNLNPKNKILILDIVTNELNYISRKNNINKQDLIKYLDRPNVKFLDEEIDFRYLQKTPKKIRKETLLFCDINKIPSEFYNDVEYKLVQDLKEGKYYHNSTLSLTDLELILFCYIKGNPLATRDKLIKKVVENINEKIVSKSKLYKKVNIIENL